MKKLKFTWCLLFLLSIFNLSVNASGTKDNISKLETISSEPSTDIEQLKKDYEQAEKIAESKGFKLIDSNRALENIFDNEENKLNNECLESGKIEEKVKRLNSEDIQMLNNYFPENYSSSTSELLSEGDPYLYVDLTYNNWESYRCISFSLHRLVKMDVRITDSRDNYVTAVENLSDNPLCIIGNAIGSTTPVGSGESILAEENRDLYDTYIMLNDFFPPSGLASIWVIRQDLSRDAAFQFWKSVPYRNRRKAEYGSWTPASYSPDPDGLYYSVDKVVYLNPAQAYAYYRLVSNDNILEIRDTVMNFTFSQALTYFIDEFKVSTTIALIMTGMIELLPSDFTSLTAVELDSIEEAGGGIIDDEGGTHMANGIAIKSVTVWRNSSLGGLMPVFLNIYDAHLNTELIFGVTGYEGTFDLDDIMPLWRGSL